MTKSEIQRELHTGIVGKEIHCLGIIDSTNIYSKKLASEGEPEGTVVYAEHQTAGRGRFNRTWVSEPGANLTFSVILRPQISPEQTGLLSMYAAISVIEAIKEISFIPPGCKWPNDVLLNGKKCCGILSEGVTPQPAVIIGIGLNVNQTKFPSELANSATSPTSIAIECGRSFNRTALLVSILRRLDHHYTLIQRGDTSSIVKTWLLYDSTIGKSITVNRGVGQITGKAMRIDPDGGLVLSVNGIENKVLSGDVSLSKDINQ